MNVAIYNWPFKESTNTLQVNFRVDPVVGEGSNTNGLCEDSQSVEQSVRWTRITFEDTTMYRFSLSSPFFLSPIDYFYKRRYTQFQPNAVIDTRMRSISFISVNKAFSITAVLPHFWESAGIFLSSVIFLCFVYLYCHFISIGS